jgi:Xaa-Pro dipeptidase
MVLMKTSAKQHARRVQEKLGVEEGLIYLPGQRSRNNEDSDMPAPYRQLRYFYYLTGFVGFHLDAMLWMLI